MRSWAAVYSAHAICASRRSLRPFLCRTPCGQLFLDDRREPALAQLDLGELAVHAAILRSGEAARMYGISPSIANRSFEVWLILIRTKSAVRFTRIMRMT